MQSIRDGTQPRLLRSRRHLAVLSAALLVSLMLLLWISPSEKRLGDIVKLVYLHGALVRTGMLTFFAAGLAGLVAGVGLRRNARQRAAWERWTWLLEASALVTWLIYSLSSMLVTYLAWGVAVAWGEPRVQASVRVLLASVVLFGVGQLVGHSRFRAAVAVIMAMLAAWLISSAGVIQHPIDPIGDSSSVAIKAFYVLINLCVLSLVACLALWLEAHTRPRQAS
jgi:hypothetical protein